MKDKKANRAMTTRSSIGPAAAPAAGPLTTACPPAAEQYRRPGNTRQVPQQNILATNAQARSYLNESHERQQRTGEWDWSPTLEKARREAERSRIGRPGGSTFTKENVTGKKE